jgi:hypothetical protein
MLRLTKDGERGLASGDVEVKVDGPADLAAME